MAGVEERAHTDHATKLEIFQLGTAPEAPLVSSADTAFQASEHRQRAQAPQGTYTTVPSSSDKVRCVLTQPAPVEELAFIPGLTFPEPIAQAS